MKIWRAFFPILMLLPLTLTGCAAMQVAIEKKNLKVETLMSDTIFLDVENQAGRSVFVDIRNTSDKDLNITHMITARLEGRGYTIAPSAKNADYILQVNILQIGQADPSALRSSVMSGYGSVLGGGLTGALAGAGIAAISGAGSAGMTGALAGGAIAGAAAEMIAGSLVKDVTFSMVTDIMISEKTTFKVKESQRANLDVGRGTSRTQSIERQSNRQRYQTRIASIANKVNLTFQEALPALEDGLARSIAGIF